MNGSWRARFGAAAAVALVAGTSLVALGGGTPVGATTETADPNVADNAAGSLRALVTAANDGDTILVQAGATYVLDTTVCDSLRITKAITIQSTSATQNATIKQTCTGQRVIKVDGSPGQVTLRNVTITGGVRSNSGGGIRSDSSNLLLLDGVEVTGNVSDESGGGIDAHGPLTIIKSTIADNCATAGGGAIIAHNGTGPLTIANSTITGNTQDGGGAIFLATPDRPLTLTYVTLVGNTSTGTSSCVFPASIDAAGDDTDVVAGDPGTEAQNAPVANLFLGANTFASFGSVIGLPAGANGVVNCSTAAGTLTSKGYNFEQGGGNPTSCGLTGGTGDVQSGGDPLLGALGANGGPTTTRVPQTGSPLLNAIPVAACGGPANEITTDQRGIARPQETGCEIGAVEVLGVVEIAPRFTG